MSKVEVNFSYSLNGTLTGNFEYGIVDTSDITSDIFDWNILHSENCNEMDT